jgi:hypothetical protein
VPRIDDARGFKRILLGIEDGEGNFHVAFLGKWSSYVLRDLQLAASRDKRLQEAAKLRATADEVYKRDYPYACGAEFCRMRFKSRNGLRIHAAAKARHQGDWEISTQPSLRVSLMADAADFTFEAFTPEGAVNFYRSKAAGGRFAFDYRDVWQAEHAKSFVVAKVMTADVLDDLHDAVDQAINDGLAFEDFRDNLEPILKAKGWWGKRPMTDPLTGEEREVQLGSNRRLQIIYDTNLRTSYAAGAYEQSMQAQALLPYWRYIDPSANPRLQHLGWSGTVLRKDNPWWASHLPPLAYNCHCYVDDLGPEDLSRHPLSASAPPDETYTYSIRAPARRVRSRLAFTLPSPTTSVSALALTAHWPISSPAHHRPSATSSRRFPRRQPAL